MQFGINLLSGEKPDLNKAKLPRKIKIGIGVVLGIYIIVVIALYSVSYYFSSSEKKIKDEIGQVEAKIKTLEKREGLELALKQRIEEASRILKERDSVKQAKSDYSEMISQIQVFAWPGVSVRGAEIERGKILINGTFDNYLVLLDFFDSLDRSQFDWSLINLETLGRSADGTYRFSFVLRQ